MRSSFLLLCLLTNVGVPLAAAQFFLPDHPYVRPPDARNRSPCPGLNALANHGFINWNGTGIAITDIAAAGEAVFGISASLLVAQAQGDLDDGVEQAGTTADGTPTVDLKSFYAHNIVEHDGSLVRRDEILEPLAQFNETLFLRLVANASDGKITFDDVLVHLTNRVHHSRVNNPTYNFSFTDDVALILGGEMALLSLMGGDPESRTLRVDYLNAFLDDSRIPDDFVPRLQQGLPALTSTDPFVTAMISEATAAANAAIIGPIPGSEDLYTMEDCNRLTTQLSSDVLSTVGFSSMFREDGLFVLGEAGEYTGPAEVEEYLLFASASSPFLDSDITMRAELDLIDADLTSGSCFFRYIVTREWSTDPDNAADYTFNAASMFRARFELSDLKFSRGDLYFTKDFLSFFLGIILSTEKTMRFVCKVLKNNCADVYELNGSPSDDECIERLGQLPLYSGEFFLDGLDQGCRMLHGAFATQNQDHCPHISFSPIEDVNGRIKCQESKNIGVDGRFDQADLDAFDAFISDPTNLVDPATGFSIVQSPGSPAEPLSTDRGSPDAFLSFRPLEPLLPCADGSPAGIYVEDSSDVAFRESRDHVIVFIGDGACTSPEDCENGYLSEPFKFSSTFYPRKVSGHTVLSRDPQVNVMHAYTKWLVPSCSQDFFLGDIKKGKIGNFTHAGSVIFDRSLAYWKDRMLSGANISEGGTVDMSIVENLVVVGVSAGAIGVMNKISRIRETVEAVGGAKNVRFLLDSPSVLSDRPQGEKDFRAAATTYLDLGENPLCHPLHPFSRLYVSTSALPCCLSTHCMLRHDDRLSSFLFALPDTEAMTKTEELLVLDSAYDALTFVDKTRSGEEDEDGNMNDIVRDDVNSLLFLIEFGGQRKTRAMETVSLAKASAYSSEIATKIEEARVQWVFTSCVTHTFLVPSVDLLHLGCEYGDYSKEIDFGKVCNDYGSATEFKMDFLSLWTRLWRSTDTWDVAELKGTSIHTFVSNFVADRSDQLSDSWPPYLAEEVIDFRQQQCSGPNCVEDDMEDSADPSCQYLIDIDDPFVAVPVSFQVVWFVFLGLFVAGSLLLRVRLSGLIPSREKLSESVPHESGRSRASSSFRGKLSVRGITVVAKNGSCLLQDAGITVERSTLNAICGRSGSGKSTLLRVLSQLKHTDLRVTIQEGEAVLKNIPKAYLRQEDVMLSFSKLVPSEYLALTAKIYGTSDKKLTELLDFTEQLFSRGPTVSGSGTKFNPFVDAKIKNLSGGQRRILSIASTLLLEPELILLDEPLSGLDTVSCLQVMDALNIIAETHACAVLVVVHQPSNAILQRFDRLFVLRTSKVVCDINIQEVGERHASVLLSRHLCDSVPEPQSDNRRSRLTRCSTRWSVSLMKFSAANRSVLLCGEERPFVLDEQDGSRSKKEGLDNKFHSAAIGQWPQVSRPDGKLYALDDRDGLESDDDHLNNDSYSVDETDRPPESSESHGFKQTTQNDNSNISLAETINEGEFHTPTKSGTCDDLTSDIDADIDVGPLAEFAQDVKQVEEAQSDSLDHTGLTDTSTGDSDADFHPLTAPTEDDEPVVENGTAAADRDSHTGAFASPEDNAICSEDQTAAPVLLRQLYPVALRANKQFGWGWFDVVITVSVFAIVSLLLSYEKFFPAQAVLASLVMTAVPGILFSHRILEYTELWLAHQIEMDDQNISLAAFQIASATFTFPVPIIAVALAVTVSYGILRWSFRTYFIQILFSVVQLMVPLQFARVLGVMLRGRLSLVIKIYTITLFLSFIFSSVLVASRKLPSGLRWLVLLSMNFWAISGAVLNQFDDENYSNDDKCFDLFMCLLSDGRFIVYYLGFAPLSTSFRALGVLTGLLVALVIIEYFLLRYQCAGKSLSGSLKRERSFHSLSGSLLQRARSFHSFRMFNISQNGGSERRALSRECSSSQETTYSA